MKRNLINVAALLALCALSFAGMRQARPVGSPFSISHVKLGMTEKEVLAILGDCERHGSSLYHNSEEWMGDVQVQFDPQGKAIWVSGGHLELNGLDYKPVRDSEGHEEMLPQFEELLREAEGQSGEPGDFVHEWYYPKLNLTIQTGCCGWSFRLRQPGPLERVLGGMR